MELVLGKGLFTLLARLWPFCWVGLYCGLGGRFPGEPGWSPRRRGGIEMSFRGYWELGGNLGSCSGKGLP